MIKIENLEVYGWKAAIRGMRGKGYRKTKNGKYECLVSVGGDSISLGTYSTENEAREEIFLYRKDRLEYHLKKYGLELNDCKVYTGKYIVLPNGMIFNLHGKNMVGVVDRNGYIHGLLNRKNVQYHRVIALLFCNKPDGKDFVNHIDGNKQNNNAGNLEWVTRSENTIHSFKNGLQKVITNQYGTYEVRKYDKN